MRRLRCRLFGHNWQWLFSGVRSTCMVCLRCHQNGWRLM